MKNFKEVNKMFNFDMLCLKFKRCVSDLDIMLFVIRNVAIPNTNRNNKKISDAMQAIHCVMDCTADTELYLDTVCLLAEKLIYIATNSDGVTKLNEESVNRLCVDIINQLAYFEMR